MSLWAGKAFAIFLLKTLSQSTAGDSSQQRSALPAGGVECVCNNACAEPLRNAPPSSSCPVLRCSARAWLSPAFTPCPSSPLFQVQQRRYVAAFSAGNPHGAARGGAQPILTHRSQPPDRNHRRSGVLLQHGHLSAGKETERRPSPGRLLKTFMWLLLTLHITDPDYSGLDAIKKLLRVEQADFITYFGSKRIKITVRFLLSAPG